MAAELDGNSAEDFSERSHTVRKALQVMLGKKLQMSINADILVNGTTVVYSYVIVLNEDRVRAVALPCCPLGTYQIRYAVHHRKHVKPKSVAEFLLLVYEALCANSNEVHR